MILEIILIHSGLGILLFFITNWIGKHSFSVGYISMSVFARAETAPAFNLVFRVLTPIIYLIILSALFYGLGLDNFVHNIFLVNIYYLAFRLCFNLVTGRGLLLNWTQQLLYSIFIIGLSYITYNKLLIHKINILPDLENLSNELWIIILIFIYQVLNNVRLSSRGTERRKLRYLQRMYSKFREKYGSLIDSNTENKKLRGLIYAILITENFNRPKVIRWIEYLNFFFTGKPHSLGIMQHYTHKRINDIESIEMGIAKILNAYHHELEEYISGRKGEYYSEYSIKRILAGAYNTGEDYNDDIEELWDEIMIRFFPEFKEDSLLPEFAPSETTDVTINN